MITINNINNSSDLLFSIPVHEKQDIVNNTIENIFNFNPNCKIILHINKNFTSFNKEKSKYSNLYINKTDLEYIPHEDLLIYHVSNFKYCIENNVQFKYFIFSASNELFIKKGAIHYINIKKNGLQIVEYDKEIDWHNFKKNIDEEDVILHLFDILKKDTLYGGQTEGQFYEKEIFNKICEYYLEITKNNSIKIKFEAEEIIPSIVFKSLNLSHGDPINLQNYTNNIDFSVDYINNLIKGIYIEDKPIKNQLTSPHINKTSENIYSIKRVDRTFNKIRNYLSKKGLILNNSDYYYNINYYSNSSSLIIKNKDEIQFNKLEDGFKDFQWFGFFLEKGMYNIEFEIISNSFINRFYNCGIKLHHPFNYTITHFLDNAHIKIKKVKIPIINYYDQDVIFIFDDYLKKLQINFKNLTIVNSTFNNNTYKKNLILVVFSCNNNKLNHLNNTLCCVINILDKIYNIYIYAIVKDNNYNNIEKDIIEQINPHYISYSNNFDFENIIYLTNEFINKFNISHNIIFLLNLDLIFYQNISKFDFIINKINFLCYKNNLNSYDIDYSISIIPSFYFKNIINIKNNKNKKNKKIIDFMKNSKLKYNLIINDFYSNNDYFSFDTINNKFTNTGFLFETNFIKNIYYYNNYSYFKKMNSNHFYFFKNITNKYQEFIWCGYNLKFSSQNNKIIKIKIKFSIKINTSFIINNHIGIKTHYPNKIYNEFLKNIDLQKFTDCEFYINIQKKNQLIIFNFDNYLPEFEFEIKNMKLIYNND